MSNVIDKLCAFYAEFKPELLNNLESIYTQDVQFKDPLHEIRDIGNLRHYFAGMMEGLDQCRFKFYHRLDMPTQGEAIIFWTMEYGHPRLAAGKLLTLTGNSHLRYTDKVFYHRDYFDAGAMLYEHIPLLGLAIRHVKKRLAAT